MTAYEARVGDTVKDMNTGKIGKVMGFVGPNVQLRPLSGGTEWDARPNALLPATLSQALSTGVADVNARSRTVAAVKENRPLSPTGPDSGASDAEPAPPSGRGSTPRTPPVCRQCDEPITDPSDVIVVAYEQTNSGPGRTVWAHRAHAHLVHPDPRLLQLLARIRSK